MDTSDAPLHDRILKADLRSRVLRNLYYDRQHGLLALEMRHGKIRLYSDAPAEIVDQLIEHPAPGAFYNGLPLDALGTPLSRFKPRGAAFLLRVRKMRLS